MAAGAGEASSLALGLIFGAARLAKDIHEQSNRSRRCKALNGDRLADNTVLVTAVRQKSRRKNFSFELVFDLDAAHRPAFRDSLITKDREAAEATNIILNQNRRIFFRHLSLWRRVTEETLVESIQSLERFYGVLAKVLVRVAPGDVIEEGSYVNAPGAFPLLNWQVTARFQDLTDLVPLPPAKAFEMCNEISGLYKEPLIVRAVIDDPLLNRLACQQLIESGEIDIIPTILLGKILKQKPTLTQWRHYNKFRYSLEKMVDNWQARGFLCDLRHNPNALPGTPYARITFRRVNNYSGFQSTFFKETAIAAAKDEFLTDAEKVSNELVNNVIKLINARRTAQ